MNSATCQLPHLSRALQFPQQGARNAGKQELKIETKGSTQSLGDFVAAHALGLVFKALALLAKPLEMVGGKTFLSPKVEMDF